jgi:hypothetical protein
VVSALLPGSFIGRFLRPDHQRREDRDLRAADEQS